MANERFDIEQDQSADISNGIETRRPYVAPVLTTWGGVAEFTQLNATNGGDGGVADCSSSV